MSKLKIKVDFKKTSKGDYVDKKITDAFNDMLAPPDYDSIHTEDIGFDIVEQKKLPTAETSFAVTNIKIKRSGN